MTKAITVQNISKKFNITPYQINSLRTNLQRAVQLQFVRRIPFWALHDLNFEVEEGEVFGIIGANGSGKSTLLKILSKITAPTKGRIELSGKVNTLLEVGTGFHPELSGRENIFLNGSILGLKRSEIKSKFDQIVEFSEVETFLDNPVKHYSSGMYVRLAFAVAAHLDPDILIVDEVLSVGDLAFQRKCLQKMEDEVLQGRTVLFVSHNMDQVQRLCTRVMLLNQGNCMTIGKPDETINQYRNSVRGYQSDTLDTMQVRRGTGVIRFTKVELLDYSGRITTTMATGSKILFRLHYQGEKEKISHVLFRILIKSISGQVVIALFSNMSVPLVQLIDGHGVVECQIDRLPLNTGRYLIDVDITNHQELVDIVHDVCSFEVVKGSFYPTGDLPDSGFPVLVDYTWTIPG